MAKENASNLDFHKQFGFPFAPFNVPAFGTLPQICLAASFASGDKKKVVANWIKKVNAMKPSQVVTRWVWDAAAAQGLCQLVGFKLGRNWGSAGPGTAPGLAATHLPTEPAQILSCGEAACQKTSCALPHFSSGALAGFGTELLSGLRGRKILPGTKK